MGLVVWFTATRVIKRPINNLKESAAYLAQGQLDQDIDTSREDELGSLAQSFSEMRDAIRKKIDDLQSLMAMLNEKELGVHIEFVNYR